MLATVANKKLNLGNGGADYNQSDAEMKKKIAQNQLSISNPTFKNNEVTRALQVIKDRESQGLDTSAQNKYLTQNLGYNPSAASPIKTTSTGIGAAAGAMAGVNTAKSVQNTQQPTQQQNNSQVSQLLSSMMSRVNQPNKEFSYDPNSDPAYQAALQRARANIDAGNSQVQAEMNRRGLLNSTITSDRMGEISASEMGRVEYETLPQLMNQAYQRYQNDLAQQQQNFSNMGALAQMYSNEDQRGFDNTITEANLTGNYTSPEAKALVQSLLGLKQQAETKGITAQERAGLSSQADGIRAQLQALGIDPAQFAATVNYNSASKVNPGVRTLQGQQMDLANKQANNATAMDWSQLSGQILTPQSDWAGYARQIAAGGNPLTLAGQQQAMSQQQQQFSQQQQALQNAWAIADATGFVDQTLSNLTGLPVGTPTLQARQYMENLALDQAKFQYGMDSDAYDRMMAQNTSSTSTGNVKTQTANDYYNVVKGMMQRDEDGKLSNQQSVEDFIIMSGLSADEMKKLYTYAGIPIPKN